MSGSCAPTGLSGYDILCSGLEHFEQRFADLSDGAHFLGSDHRVSRMLADSLYTIQAVRPTLTLLPRAVVEAVLLSEGSIGSAQHVARQLGLPNRFKLARMLKRAGLPPLHRLAEWAMLESWIRAAEDDGESLCHQAFRLHRHPSACYRLVKELTGMRWGEVRARGLTWLRRRWVQLLQ